MVRLQYPTSKLERKNCFKVPFPPQQFVFVFSCSGYQLSCSPISLIVMLNRQFASFHRHTSDCATQKHARLRRLHQTAECFSLSAGASESKTKLVSSSRLTPEKLCFCCSFTEHHVCWQDSWYGCDNTWIFHHVPVSYVLRSSRGTEEIKVLVGYRRWAVAMTALLPSLWSFPSCFLASCYSWIGVAVIRQREQRHLKTTAPAFEVCGSSTWRTWCWKEKVREGNCFHHYYNCHCFFVLLFLFCCYCCYYYNCFNILSNMEATGWPTFLSFEIFTM